MDCGHRPCACVGWFHQTHTDALHLSCAQSCQNYAIQVSVFLQMVSDGFVSWQVLLKHHWTCVSDFDKPLLPPCLLCRFMKTEWMTHTHTHTHRWLKWCASQSVIPSIRYSVKLYNASHRKWTIVHLPFRKAFIQK